MKNLNGTRGTFNRPCEIKSNFIRHFLGLKSTSRWKEDCSRFEKEQDQTEHPTGVHEQQERLGASSNLIKSDVKVYSEDFLNYGN